MKNKLCLLAIILFTFSCAPSTIDPYPKRGYLLGHSSGVASYRNGVNDALDTFVLLDNELKLKNENKSIHERMEIIRARLKVKQDNRILLNP
jgi:hypothetical protein